MKMLMINKFTSDLCLLTGALIVLLVFSGGVSAEKNVTTLKPNLVLLPIDINEKDDEHKAEYGAAVQEGLQKRYTVFFGSEVEKELEKEYKRIDCDAETCTQNVAVAFNGELIADVAVKRIDGGYLLKLVVRNVLTGQVIETQTDPCEECNQFSVMSRLRVMGSGKNSVSVTSKNKLNASVLKKDLGGKAILIVDSRPSNSKITINGKESGKTPYQGLNHKVGEKLLIEITHPFYKPQIIELEIQQAITQVQPVELELGNGKALITIQPFKSNTIIYVDGEAKGNAPLFLTLRAGDYVLKASHKGLSSEDYNLRLNDRDNRIIPLSFAPTVNKFGMEFVTIPGGSFDMGSDDGSNMKPVHHVTLKSFKMMATEVTQGQWQTIMGVNPSNFKSCGPSCPVDNVNLTDVQSFIKQLSKETGGKYRLPSESEWEYAARAGSAKKYSWGDEIDCSQARYGYHTDQCGKQETTFPVKSFWPNDFGLYDMHGNVRELTEDCWSDTYEGAPADGLAWREGECKDIVLRGGSWYSSEKSLRSTHRSKANAEYRYTSSGFRLVQQ